MCEAGSSRIICSATAMAGYKCPPVPPPAKKKYFSSDSLEIVTEPRIYIGIVLELTEKCLRVIAEENISAGFDRQVVVDLVINVRSQIDVLVRGRVVCKK